MQVNPTLAATRRQSILRPQTLREVFNVLLYAVEPSLSAYQVATRGGFATPLATLALNELCKLGSVQRCDGAQSYRVSDASNICWLASAKAAGVVLSA